MKSWQSLSLRILFYQIQKISEHGAETENELLNKSVQYSDVLNFIPLLIESYFVESQNFEFLAANVKSL